MNSKRRSTLIGAVVTMPTFCDDNYNLLLEKQRKHVNWLIENGMVEGNGVLLIAGGAGEGYFLNDNEWEKLVSLLPEVSQGRVPTMAGIYETSARKAAQKAKYAAKAGIDFLQVGPPHYMTPSDNNILGFYEMINDSTDIGIMAYNTPWAIPGGLDFSESVLEKLVGLENMDGIKWYCGDIKQYFATFDSFGKQINFIDNHSPNLVGMSIGMAGFVDLKCNVAPKLTLKKWDLIKRNQFEELRKLQSPLDQIDAAVQSNDMGEGPAAQLRLKSMGLNTGPCFPSQTQPSPEDFERVGQAVNDSGILEWCEWQE